VISMTPAERLKQTQKTSVKNLAQEFVQPYNLDVQPPLENSPFAFHDAGHRFANIPATIYGELLQNVHDKAAFDKLYGSSAIHGNPLSYGEYPKSHSRFVNYGNMPDAEQHELFKQDLLQRGVDSSAFEPGGEAAWDTRVNTSITAQQNELSGILATAKNKFNKGEYTFFAGAGNYNPEQGFMPSPDLRNVRNLAPEDINTARVRGEKYADVLLQGYKEAVQKGEYKPQSPSVRGMVNAVDFGEAVMQPKNPLKIPRGWADEGIFPYQDTINALSNPPARIDPRAISVPREIEALTDKANEARRARTVNRLAKTIGTGFNTTTDLTGSVPLFDPAFRQAVEEGNVGKAARQVATEYVAGTLAAPVVGAGMGVLQRVAPQAARVATSALGVARTANPIAVTSQLGGSSRINPQADRAAIQSQFQRAEAARKRGGKWKFPTPFGTLRIPELGISEAGGLFFR
jgi:hypothetical protein